MADPTPPPGYQMVPTMPQLPPGYQMVDPNAEPDAPTWLGRRMQDIRGKQDPRYKDVGTVFDQFKDELNNPTGAAATLGASDPQMGDVIRKTLGDRFIRKETDANGYDVYVTRGPDGKEQRGYLNKPGLDSQDIARSVRGALPYALTGGAAGVAARGAGVLANVGAQALAATGTSVAGDVAQIPLGSEQGVEVGKAIAAGFGGAAGPVLAKAGGALWQRFVQEPKFFDRATGVLTPEGQAVAKQMGLDPQDMAAGVQRTFGKTYAADPQAAADMVQSGKLDFGVQQTLGQRTKDPEQLMIEKAMRSGAYEDKAKRLITSLDEQQRNAINLAVKDKVPHQLVSDPNGNPSTISKNQWALTKDNLWHGENVQDALQTAQKSAKSAESAAWDQTSPVYPSAGARPMLEDSLRENLGDFAHVLDPENTPTAYRMGQHLVKYMNGEAPSNELISALNLKSNGSIDSMRRVIGSMVADAQTPTDKAAARAIYQGYNNWVEKAADYGALTGSPADIAKFRTAVDISKQVKNIFQPRENGRPTAGAKILEDVLNQDTPEKVISAIFSGPRAGIKDGSLEALQKMKEAVTTYGNKQAATDLWSSLKIAHWSNMVIGKDGQMLDYKVMLNNLRTAMHNQKSLTETLYTPADRAFMARFMKTLEGITYKDPNPSGTATGLAVLTKQFFNKLIEATGPAGKYLYEHSGIPRNIGAVAARKAVSQLPPSVAARPLNALAAPITSALGSGYARQSP